MSLSHSPRAPHVDWRNVVDGLRRAAALFSGQANLADAYRSVSPHVLSDIGLDATDIERAHAHPREARQVLAESLKRRAHRPSPRPVSRPAG